MTSDWFVRKISNSQAGDRGAPHLAAGPVVGMA